MRKLLLIVMLFLVPPLSEAMNVRSPKDSLKDALLCRGNSLDIIRQMTKSQVFTDEIATTTWGDELDERNVVIVKGGLSIAGAKTYAVISSFDSPYASFGGIVSAEFTGNYEAVIKELGLKPVTVADGETALGKFALPKPTGEENEICPPTIVLTPLFDGKFLLGCGWCNG